MKEMMPDFVPPEEAGWHNTALQKARGKDLTAPALGVVGEDVLRNTAAAQVADPGMSHFRTGLLPQDIDLKYLP
jgi:hypothetical protein